MPSNAASDPTVGTGGQETETTMSTMQPTAVLPTESIAPSATVTEPSVDCPSWNHKSALTRFLTEINRSGSIRPSETTQAPGTLPAVDRIPIADQSLVGESVTIIFAQEQQEIPFYYCYDADTGWERLAVVITAEKIPLLMVFQTKLGGTAKLCQAIASEREINATILSMTNISYEEGCAYVRNACQLASQNQKIDIFANGISAISGQYIGMVGKDHDGKAVNLLAGAESSQLSDSVQSGLNVWFRIFERFGLTQMIIQA